MLDRLEKLMDLVVVLVVMCILVVMCTLAITLVVSVGGELLGCL